LKYLLVIFVIAVALAPLIQFLPSKRQRKIADMRESAALCGLFVEFRDLPGLNLVHKPPAGVIYYGRRLPTSRSKPVETGAWMLLEDGWRKVGGTKPITALLEDLPIEILAASVDEFSCGVYWTESAEEGAVEQIKQVLEHWSDELMQ
jgi:hypothetical protein